MERIRCFIAIDVENSDIIAKISKVMQALNFFGNKLKLVETGNIHLTLRFLGGLPKSIVDEIIEVLDTVDYHPFTITLKGLGVFPTPSRPRVIWVGIEEGVEDLKKLVTRINTALRRLRLPPPDKPFSPHVTIARVKRPVDTGKLMRILDAHATEFGPMLVDRIRLKKSTLTSRGPIYTILYEKLLSG